MIERPAEQKDESMDYDGATALIVVDVQNDFASRDGNLYVTGGEEVVPVVNEATDEALAAGALVVYTQDLHPPDTPHFAKDGGIWPVHCVRETWGAEFHRDLKVTGDVVPRASTVRTAIRDSRSGTLSVGTRPARVSRTY